MSFSVLIADSSSEVRAQIVETLKPLHAGRVLEAHSGRQALDLLTEEPVDLIIADLCLPEISGEELLVQCQSRDRLNQSPFIVLSNTNSLESKVQCLELGASDYLSKPFDPSELVARVRVQLKIKGLQDNLRQSNHQLQMLAKTDPLTGLANRRYLGDHLERELKRSQRKQEPCSLIMVAIDNFDEINQRLGQQEGDRILAVTASLLERQLREYDLAARYGGGVFALILPETPMDRAMQVAERIRLDFAAQRFIKESQSVKATISLGVAAYPLSGIETPDDLITAACGAMKQAKKEGHNRVCSMTSSIQKAEQALTG